MEYLGMIITPGEVHMDPGKVNAVRNWPPPKMLKDVRGFIGFSNFYQRFIKDFSAIARTLHGLTKKDVPWHWDKEQQVGFNTIMRNFLPGLRLMHLALQQEASSLKNMRMVFGIQLCIAQSL